MPGSLNKKLPITSNIINRVNEIRNGSVYDDWATFIDELIQNTQRAGASIVNMDLNEDHFSINDNGSGCRTPDFLFTFDESNYDNYDNKKVGFGVGFSSVYMVSDRFTVHSCDWVAELNVVEALRNKSLLVDIVESSIYRKGFMVSLHGERIRNHREDIQKRILSLSSVIPDITFFLNGEKIEKRSLFDSTSVSSYSSLFENRMYQGRLNLNNTPYGIVKVYYEYRFVSEITTDGCSGVILLRPNAVHLRAPDRKGFIKDEKYWKLKNKLSSDLFYLIQQVLKHGEPLDIKEYADVIAGNLDVQKYIRFLEINEKDVLSKSQTKNKNKEEFVNTDEPDVTPSEHEQENGNDSSSPRIVDTVRKKSDEHYFNHPQVLKVSNTRDLKKVNIRNINRKKNVVWVEKNYWDDYKSQISEYEYWGVFTFVSPHILYDRALQYLGIPHVSMLERNAITDEQDVKRTGALTKKEERVYELFDFLERKLNLPSNTFHISDIYCKRTISLRGNTIHQEKVTINGFVRPFDGSIHFNRKSLSYGKLNCISLGKDSLGIHDVKFLMANEEVIAHELAHLLEYTSDNTMEHLEATARMRKKIANIILDSDNLF